MEDFEGIRPYTDEEVPGVIDRLVEDPELGKAAAALLLPGLEKVSRKWIATDDAAGTSNKKTRVDL